jgi:PKD repeat protein
MYPADLNNDGNTDILWTGNNTVAWIPNNGDDTFGDSQIISNQAAYAQKVLAADVDNDGDIDVLSASIYSSDDPLTTANKIVWFSNNGNGTFAPEEVITTNIINIQSIATADLDNDGDLDLASASYSDNKVAWYENLLSYLPPPATTPPTASFNTYPTTTDTLSICQGQTVYFNNTSQNATNYNWTFGDGTQSNDSNPAHTFNTSGNYEVELVAYKVESDNPCVLAVNDTFTVYYNSTTINVANNDFTCNQAYSIAIVSQPMYGSVSVTGTNIVYNLYGYPIPYTVSFYYQIITPQGASTALVVITTAPCLVLEDDVATTTMNTPVEVNIGCNDFVCNSFAAVQVYNIAPQHGTIELGSTFTTGGCLGYYITYTPDSSFVGTDCFTYTASDGSTEPATATICITVTDSSGAANGKLNLSTSINNNNTPKQAKRIPNKQPESDSPHLPNTPFRGQGGTTTHPQTANLPLPNTPFRGQGGTTHPETAYLPLSNTPFRGQGGTTHPETANLPLSNTPFRGQGGIGQGGLERSNGELTDTARLIVVVLPGTAPNLSCVGSVCAGDEVQYSTDANCTNYNWTITGAETVTGQGTPNINVTWGSGPAGTIELLVDNCTPDVCALPLSVPIGIMPSTATITGDSIICANQTAIYTLPYINGAEYTWSISPASAGNITAGQYTPTVTINWLAQNATLHATINHHLANCSGTATLGISLRPRLALTPDVPLICVGNALQIGTSPNTACNWELSSGTIINGQGSSSIEAIWQDAGTQTITATAINPTQVCQPTETTTITTKNIAPTPTNITGASQICPQQIYTYTAVPSIAGTQLSWTVQGGTLINGQNTNTIQVQWYNAEPYSLAVYRQYTATPSCPSNAFNLAINALPTDAFSITGSNNVCAGTTSNYTATSTLTNPTYDWVITPATAGTIVSGQGTANISVIWSTNPQSANITAAYCTQNQSFDVVINALPQVSITQNSTLCVGSSTTLTFTPAYNIHTWTNSSGSTISNNATATVTQSDTYTLTIADTNGCTATSIIAVDTLPRPTALIYTAGKSTFCIQEPGQSSTFEAAVGQYFTYQWYKNGNPIAGATNPTYTHVSTADIATYNYYVVVSHAQTGCTTQSNNWFIYQLDCTGGTGPGCPDCPPPPTCTLIAGSSANFSIVTDNNDCNTFTFVNTSTGSPTNNIWLLDGTQFTSTDLTYTYNQIGKDRVYLLTGFTNLTPQPNECYLVAVDSVRVPIKADFNATQNTCAGDTVTFTDYSIQVVQTTLTNWTWDFGDGTTATNIQNPTHVYANSGVYTATLSVTNDTCISTISQNVAVQGIPIVSFSAASIGCATNALSFTPNQSNLATFEWAFGNDDSTTLSNPSYAYPTNGTYNVSLTATDVYGCANATYTQAIDILPAPAIENITATDTLLCFGETSTLTAPANATAYLWSNGSTSPQITVSQSGNYSVRVTLDNGCYYNTPAQVVTVYNPPPAQANIYSATGTYCQNDTVMATVTPGYTYLWNNGNTTSSFITEPNQFYFVTVTDTTTGCSAVSEPILGVSYDNPETPQIAPGNLVFCEGETHLLTANGNTNYNYTWSNNQSGNTIEVFSSGTYVVTVTNQQHCTATNSVQVQVTPRPNASAFPTGCYDICSGDTISVPLPTNATAIWYLNGTQIGAPAVSGNNLIPTQSGSYSVLLNTPFGCTDASDTLTLEVLNNCFEPPLPVTLLSFDGTVKENGNLLRWISATEINCHHYTLYASTNANANNANSFVAITQLSGKGNTNTTHTYTFMHPTNEPITYYRLTQTDFDGTETIVGNVVLMRNKAGTDVAINISPNPTHNDFTLTLFGNTLPAAINVFVLDVAGHIVQQNNYATTPNITINRRNLPNGMYFVRVQDANNGQIIGVNKVVLD